MGLAQQVGKNLGKVMAPIRAGVDKLASRRLGLDGAHVQTLAVSSSAFSEGGVIPAAYTADGGGFAPPIAWGNVPDSARSMVLVCEDPDAPRPKPFVHWLVYSLPSAATSLESAPAFGREGKNSTMKIGYAPPAPPPGHGSHAYHFQVFALDTILELHAGAGRGSLIDAMRGHVLAWGETVGTYERS
jgi:Raf kinase inhibitor-like YbhB/YbcL family protein